MSNDISKRYSFTIDTKDSKTLNNGLSFNHGDDITLIIKIIEDSQPKLLTNCSVDLIIANQSQEFPIIHRYSDGGITILDDTVTIITKSNYINLIGVNVAQLLISDEDQTITTQPFTFTTISTLLSDDMVGAVDKIDTLVELDKVIEETRSKITLVDGEITRLSQMASTVKNEVELLSESLTNKVQTLITNTDSIVSGVIRDEEQRKLNENTRITSEQERARNEQARRDAEIQRNNRENTRISSENERLASERDRVSAEISRSTSEISRNSAENKRDNAETQRVTNESSRILAETNRSSAETQRVTNETSREKAETARSSAETTRLQNENSRFTAEKNRIAAETERVDNESSRKTAESNRVSAETTRSNNETARSTAETKRQQSETLRVAAESDRASRFEAMNKVYEASAGEVEDNRKDYNGVIHSTMYEARKSDYETLDNKFGDFTHSNFSGLSDLNILNTKSGLIKNIKIKGRTLQNLSYYDYVYGDGINVNSEGLIVIPHSIENLKGIVFRTPTLKPNTKYTVIINVLKNTINGSSSTMKIHLGSYSTYFDASGNGVIKQVISTSDDVSYGLRILLRTSNATSGEFVIDYNDVLLLEGDYSQEYVPFFTGIKSIGESNVIKLSSSGINLAPINEVTLQADPTRPWVDMKGVGGMYGYKMKNTTDTWFYLKPGEYTYSYIADNCSIQCVDQSENIIDLDKPFKGGLVTFRIKSNSNSGSYGVKDLYVSPKISNYKYYPYVNNKLIIPISQPLRSLPNGRYDYLDYETFKISRKVGVRTFNGKESWVMSPSPWTSNGFYAFEVKVQDVGDMDINKVNVICDKFKGLTHAEGQRDNHGVLQFGDYGKLICFKQTEITTVDAWKSWLAQNPITVYYDLGVETYEDLDRHTMSSYNQQTNLNIIDDIPTFIDADFPIDITSEIEKNRLDFNGKTHNDMYSARMSDVGYLLDRFNESQLVEYSDKHIIANNTYDGISRDLKIKGKTLQNVAFKTQFTFDFATDKTNDNWGLSKILFNDIIMKPNTEYTFIVNVSKNTTAGHNELVWFGNVSGQDKFYTPVGELHRSPFNVGITRFKLRTKTQFSGSETEPFGIQYQRNINEGVVEYTMLVLEGDFSNVNVPYFTGIRSVGDNGNIAIVSCGKNIIKPLVEYPVDVYKGSGVDSSLISISRIKPNQIYTITSTFSENKCRVSNKMSNKILTLNDVLDYRQPNVYAYLRDKYANGRMFEYTCSGSQSKTFTSLMDSNYIYSNVDSAHNSTDIANGSFVATLINLQMEASSTSSSYAPYEECKINITLSDPLRSLPNGVSDIIDLTNGLIYRYVASYTFDGSIDEDWLMSERTSSIITTKNTAFFALAKFLDLKKTGAKCRRVVCNRLESYGESLWHADKEGIVAENNINGDIDKTQIQLSINRSKLDSVNVAGLRSWLSKNPLTVIYELETPIIEKLDISNNYIRTFDGTTNIFTEGSLIEPVITAKIPSNTQVIISNLMGENEELNNQISIMKATTDEKEMQNIEINLDQDLRLTILELGVM